MIEFIPETIPWEDFKGKFISCFGLEFTSLDQVVDKFSEYGIKFGWRRLADWEELDDSEIFQRLSVNGLLKGVIYAVPESSYGKGLGPFKLKSDELEPFIVNHLGNFKECFFNGDVLVVSFEQKSMWVFHHEGVFAYIDVSRSLD